MHQFRYRSQSSWRKHYRVNKLLNIIKQLMNRCFQYKLSASCSIYLICFCNIFHTQYFQNDPLDVVINYYAGWNKSEKSFDANLFCRNCWWIKWRVKRLWRLWWWIFYRLEKWLTFLYPISTWTMQSATISG